MSDRDELAELIQEAITPLTRGEPDFYGEAFTATADAILAAGWHPPTASCPSEEHTQEPNCFVCLHPEHGDVCWALFPTGDGCGCQGWLPMTDRDDLIGLIGRRCDCRADIQEGLADAIMAAGWMRRAGTGFGEAAQESYDQLVRDLTGATWVCVRCTSAVCGCGVGR